MRGAATANVTKMSAQSPLPVIFVQLDFSSAGGPQYIHDSLGEYTWGGRTWLGVGDLGGINAIQEGEKISPYEMVMQLAGLENTGDVFDEAINQNFSFDPCSVYVGFLGSDHKLVADPDLYWSGKISELNVAIGSANGIELTAESDLARFDQPNGALFSDANLQDKFPGDTFAKYAPQMKNIELIWGGDTVNFSGGGSSRFGGFDLGGEFGGGRLP